MRLFYPDSYRFEKSEDNSIRLIGSRKESLNLFVLEHDIVRVSHCIHGEPRLQKTWIVTDGDGKVDLKGRLKGDISRFSRPEYTMDETENSLSIKTDILDITVELDCPRIIWRDKSDKCILEDLPERAYAYDLECNRIYHYKKREYSMCFYGFGEKSGYLDKHGRRMRMFGLDAGRYNAEFSDPLYKHVPFYITFLPEQNIACGLFYDNLSTCTFDMGSEHHNFLPAYRYYTAEDGDLDYYFIYGPSIREVLEKYAYLTGYMTLPPRWSLGYLGSTMHYTEADNAQEELTRFPQLCEEHDIPCDLFHLSSGYTSGSDGKRYVFEWNKNKIPAPEKMVESFHNNSIKLTANVKPCLLSTHPRFDEVKQFGGFVKKEDTKGPQIDRFWDGDGSHLDFTNEKTYEWWQSNIKEKLLDCGIDAIWNDNNEYAIWDDRAKVDGFGKSEDLSLYGRALQPLLMARASFEALAESKPDQRPYVITRSASPGIQKYAQTWTGDNDCNWHTLKFNIPMGLGLSLSGMPNIGHDVGGFFGEKPDEELFVRWIQNGIFHPRFTIHSWHDDGSVNEPWMYPEYLPVIRETIKFRYRIIPYLYSLLFQSSLTGHPVIRPLVYEFPEDSRCHKESFDFLLGSSWLIASIWEPGLSSREVYLPAGTHWCDFNTGSWYQGGKSIEIDAPLERIPTLVRAGGIIPAGKAAKITSPLEDDKREILAFPGPESSSSFTLFEDDGVSLGYKQDGVTQLELKMDCDAESIEISVDFKKAGCKLPYSEMEWIFPQDEVREIVGCDIQFSDEFGRTHALYEIPEHLKEKGD